MKCICLHTLLHRESMLYSNCCIALSLRPVYMFSLIKQHASTELINFFFNCNLYTCIGISDVVYENI